MRKLIDKAMLKFIELKVWLHMKKNGTPFELFQFGLFWMVHRRKHYGLISRNPSKALGNGIERF